MFGGMAKKKVAAPPAQMRARRAAPAPAGRGGRGGGMGALGKPRAPAAAKEESNVGFFGAIGNAVSSAFSGKKEKIKKPVERRKEAQVHKQEVDTNVVQIAMECIKDSAVEIATGDPVFCEGCNSIFNTKSKITKEEEQQIWQCEFCNHKNKVDLEDEEMPKSDKINYIIEAAAQVHDKKGQVGDSAIVVCIDISGSMCVTEPIQGRHEILGNKQKDLMNEFKKFGDGSDQFLQGERNVTYVSRLQCVQSALTSQIRELKKEYPDKKIGIVTFNSDVTIIGDGSQDPQTVTGDKLNNWDVLMQNGLTEGAKRLSKSLKETSETLEKHIMSIEETGPTALGPALLTSVAMASHGGNGSSVILCTDGLANVGLGQFDGANADQIQEINKFYEKIGEFAEEKGVAVSLVTMESEDCNIDTVSKVVQNSGGDISRVNPINLKNDFSAIMKKEIIATKVEVKVKLHKGLEFRNESED